MREGRTSLAGQTNRHLYTYTQDTYIIYVQPNFNYFLSLILYAICFIIKMLSYVIRMYVYHNINNIVIIHIYTPLLVIPMD